MLDRDLYQFKYNKIESHRTQKVVTKTGYNVPFILKNCFCYHLNNKSLPDGVLMTDMDIKNAKPMSKPYFLSDSEGLRLLVGTNGIYPHTSLNVSKKRLRSFWVD